MRPRKDDPVVSSEEDSGHQPETDSENSPTCNSPKCLIVSPLNHHRSPSFMLLPPTYFYGVFLKHRTKSVMHLLKTKEGHPRPLLRMGSAPYWEKSHLECAPTPQQQTHPSHLIPTSLSAVPQNPLGFLSTLRTDFKILLWPRSPPLPTRHS